MSEVNMKLKNTLDGANLAEHIGGLRQIALEAELTKIEELKKASLAKVDNKSKKVIKVTENASETENQESPESSSFSFFEDRVDSSEKSFFTDESEDPDSSSGKKLWD